MTKDPNMVLPCLGKPCGELGSGFCCESGAQRRDIKQVFGSFGLWFTSSDYLMILAEPTVCNSWLACPLTVIIKNDDIKGNLCWKNSSSSKV